MKRSIFAIACASALTCACSGNSAPADSNGVYSAAPLLALASDSAAFEVEIRTLPSQPPVLGVSSVQMVVREPESDAPVSGLELEVVPWMPVMGHGSSVEPVATEIEPGTYELTGVVMFMPGTWQLRTTLAGAVTDHVVPTFQIH